MEPSQLGQFREWLGPKRASILLKPVQPVALRPFLEQLPNGRKDRRSHRAAPAPSDESELLQCLLHANLKLQEYDQSRTNFLARAIHDFHVPLTAVSGYCGLLVEEKLGPLSDEQKELLRRMKHSIGRLTRQARAMSDLSVGARKRPALGLQSGDIESTVAHAVHEVALQAKEKQIAISVSIEAPGQALVFDSSRIEQTLMNLLDNACKFTPRGGDIRVSGYPVAWTRGNRQEPERVRDGRAWACAPTAYRIDVRDSGCGISNQHLETIFEEYTSHADSTHRSGGGLGLAICRGNVNGHGGEIWAKSNGTGACFSFVLPYPDSAAKKRTMPPEAIEHRRRMGGSPLEPSMSMPVAYAGDAFIDGREGR